MVNSTVNILNVLQKTEDRIDDIVDIAEKLDTAKLTIDMSPHKLSFMEKVRVYIGGFLKARAKKHILSTFCNFIVVPITLAFLEAGDISPVLSVLILAYMKKKRAPVILEDAGIY